MPRFVSEYLQVEYEQQTIDYWSGSIVRQVIPVAEFTAMPQLHRDRATVGEQLNKKRAKQLRLERKSTALQ